MARQRRGGGFRPPELRGTLGTLLRTTLAQAGTLRDVLERGAREGRSRLDSALSTRRRQDALAELGEIVLELIRQGEIDVDELPEVRDIVTHLDEIDAGAAHEDEHAEELAHPPVRNRFDDRRGAATRGGPASRTRDRDEDGTVSSRTWSRPSSAKPQPRVWRPPADAGTEEAARPPARPSDEITARERPAPSRRPKNESTTPSSPSAAGRRPSSDEITTPSRPSKRKDPLRKGGIHFDDDEDLAEYMHPDDVPPKGTPDGES